MDFLSNISEKLKIVAVTKKQTVNSILKLPERIVDIAENKIQEALPKFEELNKHRNFKKHLIGHLQTNKAKIAVENFDLIQSIDSLKIADKVNQEAKKTNKIQPILIQINISNDPNKYGFKENEIEEVLQHINKLENIEVKGLMTILKEYDNPKLTENDFLKMQNLFNQLNETILIEKKMDYLSMGMSQDYKIAIKCKSNMLRLGTILFKEINKK
jgi:hypothetical protein